MSRAFATAGLREEVESACVPFENKMLLWSLRKPWPEKNKTVFVFCHIHSRSFGFFCLAFLSRTLVSWLRLTVVFFFSSESQTCVLHFFSFACFWAVLLPFQVSIRVFFWGRGRGIVYNLPLLLLACSRFVLSGFGESNIPVGKAERKRK